jgi:hypothetical protein
MFKRLALVLCLILVVAVGGTIAAEYAEAPLPHYDAEKGYGWMTNVPVPKPDNVQNILKVWIYYGNRAIFLDTDKDGTCDTVANFSQVDENLFQRIENTTCEATQDQVYRFLDVIKSKKIQ